VRERESEDRPATADAAGASAADRGGLEPGGRQPRSDAEDATLVQFRGAWATFSLINDGRPPTAGLHVAFPARDRQTVREFHSCTTTAGYRNNGPPGERPQYHPGYYAAYVLDPDGNNVEAVLREHL
jgi:catechol 2,3-dioxygenase-like lactoylglutathione lyase family enzyme